MSAPLDPLDRRRAIPIACEARSVAAPRPDPVAPRACDQDWVERCTPTMFDRMTATANPTADRSAALGELADLPELPEHLRTHAEVLERAGVPHADAVRMLLYGADPAEAAAIAQHMFSTPTTLKNFGPRCTAMNVLGAIMSGDERVGPELLGAMIEAHEGLIVLRPDGYLVSALRGVPLESVKPGTLEVGEFYANEDGVIRKVDDELRPIGPVIYERTLQRGPILDGAENALVNMAMGIGHFIEDPVRTLEDLNNLPVAVATLIENSPELWDRFSNMSGEDQTRVVSEIAYNLLVIAAAGGSASAAFRSGGGATAHHSKSES
jgi:hypothetical protein